MNSGEMDVNDSLKIIETSLRQTANEKTGARFYYILWGVVLTLHFGLLYLSAANPQLAGGWYDTLIWLVFPLAGLLSYLRSKRDDKLEKVTPLYERVYEYAFGGFGLAYGVMFFASFYKGQTLYPVFFMLLAGLVVFIVGGITKHVISVVCGISGIILAAVSLAFPAALIFLMASVSAFICFIIPGLLMKNKIV